MVSSVGQRMSLDGQSELKRFFALMDYIEKSPNKREIIEFSNQGDADKAGHQIRKLGGERVKVSIGASRVVVAVA